MMVANQGSSQRRSPGVSKNKSNRKCYRPELALDDDKFVAVTEPNVGTHHFRRHVGQGRNGTASYPQRTGLMEVSRAQVKSMCKVDADAYRRKQRSQQAFSKKKDASTQHDQAKKASDEGGPRPIQVPEPTVVKERAVITVREGVNNIVIKLHDVSVEQFADTLIGIQEDLDSSCHVKNARFSSRRSQGHIDIDRTPFKHCTTKGCEGIILSSDYVCDSCCQKQHPHFDPQDWSTVFSDAPPEPDFSTLARCVPCGPTARHDTRCPRRGPSTRHDTASFRHEDNHVEYIDFSPVFNMPRPYNTRERPGRRRGRSEYLPPPPSKGAREHLKSACKDIGADAATVLSNYFTVLPEELEPDSISAHFLRLCQTEIRKHSHDKGRRIKPRKFMAAVHMAATKVKSKTKTTDDAEDDDVEDVTPPDASQPAAASRPQGQQQQGQPVTPSMQVDETNDTPFASDQSTIVDDANQDASISYRGQYGYENEHDVSRFANSHLAAALGPIDEQSSPARLREGTITDSIKKLYKANVSEDNALQHCIDNGLAQPTDEPLFRSYWSDLSQRQAGSEEPVNLNGAFANSADQRVPDVADDRDQREADSKPEAKSQASSQHTPKSTGQGGAPGGDGDGDGDGDDGNDGNDGNDNDGDQGDDQGQPPGRDDDPPPPGDDNDNEDNDIPDDDVPDFNYSPDRTNVGLGANRGQAVGLDPFIREIRQESHLTQDERDIIERFAPTMVYAAWDRTPNFDLYFYPPNQWRTPLNDMLRRRRERHEQRVPPTTVFRPRLDSTVFEQNRAEADVYRNLFNRFKTEVVMARNRTQDVADITDIFDYMIEIFIVDQRIKHPEPEPPLHNADDNDQDKSNRDDAKQPDPSSDKTAPSSNQGATDNQDPPDTDATGSTMPSRTATQRNVQFDSGTSIPVHDATARSTSDQDPESKKQPPDKKVPTPFSDAENQQRPARPHRQPYREPTSAQPQATSRMFSTPHTTGPPPPQRPGDRANFHNDSFNDSHRRSFTDPFNNNSARSSNAPDGGGGGDDDDYSSSESSALSDRSDTDRSDGDQSHSQRRGGSRRSKKSKRRERSTARIFAELSKSAYNTKLPVIGTHADLRHSQTYFSQWKRKLQDTLQLTRETYRFFWNDPKYGGLRGTKTHRASLAVFQLIKSHCSSDIVHLLDQMDNQSGLAAYNLVQRRLCPTDMTAQRQAYTVFVGLTIDQGESIKSFDKRFNRALAKCHTNGVLVVPSTVTATYLEGTLTVSNQQVALQLLEYRRDFQLWESVQNVPLPNRLGIIEIQSVLERVEENSTPSQYATRATTNRPREQTADRSSRRGDSRRDGRPQAPRYGPRTANANAAEMTMKCHGCQQEGHRLRDCPTTTDAQRQRIWERLNSERDRRTGGGRGRGRGGRQQRSTGGRGNDRRSASNQTSTNRQSDRTESSRPSASNRTVTHINMCVARRLPTFPELQQADDPNYLSSSSEYSDDSTIPELIERANTPSSDEEDSDDDFIPPLVSRNTLEYDSDSDDDEDMDHLFTTPLATFDIAKAYVQTTNECDLYVSKGILYGSPRRVRSIGQRRSHCPS